MLDLYTMGERIRQAREDMGYTRETFSEMANITPRFCYDIESGKKGVSIDTLKDVYKRQERKGRDKKQVSIVPVEAK